MIRMSDYVVLEKSDGVRYLMLALEIGTLLIDRRSNFFPVEPDPNICLPKTRDKLNPERQHKTLLDGELTLNLITNEWEYLVYDLICLNDDASVARHNYRERLILAENWVTYPRCFSSNASGSLRIRVKDFYEKNQILSLFNKITKDEEGEYVYSNADRRDGPICNHNDGCIFAPVRMEYQIKTCPALLKWKPPHLNSVDFQLILECTDGAVKSHIGYQGDNGPVRLREVYFPSSQKAEWKRDFDRFNRSIIECAFDRLAGEWRYIRTRDDKDHANYSSTVIDTLESTAEEITRDQLIEGIIRSRVPSDVANITRLILTPQYRNDLYDSSNEDYLQTMPISTVPMPLPMPDRMDR